MGTSGILTGCNENHEWMLKWWWNHYSKHNNYPVTFCDLGMTPSARTFCASKGNVLTPKLSFTVTSHPEAPWKTEVPHYHLAHRPLWFLKPFAFIQSPYQRSLWLDTDCEVKGSLKPLIELPLSSAKVAIKEYSSEASKKKRKKHIIHPKADMASSGVFLFEKGSPLLEAWIEYIQMHHPIEFSEDAALSNLLLQKPFDIVHFPKKYNYEDPGVPLPNTVIRHHIGFHQKRALLQSMTF